MPEQATIDLEDLKTELQKTLSLLEDNERGLFTWNNFLNMRLTNIYNMLEPLYKNNHNENQT